MTHLCFPYALFLMQMNLEMICNIDLAPCTTISLKAVQTVSKKDPTDEVSPFQWLLSVIEFRNICNMHIQHNEKISFGKHLRFHNLHKCCVVIPACEANVCVRNCSDTIFILTGSQLRVDSTRCCTFCVYTYASPVIENSVDVSFHPFPGIDIPSGITVQFTWNCQGKNLEISSPILLVHPCNRGLRGGGERMYLEAKDYTSHSKTLPYF